MNSLDYTTIKVVGVVEPHTNGIHAYLRVIGYIDPDTGWKFKRLYPDEIKEKFPTRGLIFMPNFLKKYRNLCGQCIYTGIQVSNNEGHDQFIWDRDAGLPAEYGVVVCEEKLRQKDPEGIYETLSGYQDTTYFHDGPFYIDIHPYCRSNVVILLITNCGFKLDILFQCYLYLYFPDRLRRDDR